MKLKSMIAAVCCGTLIFSSIGTGTYSHAAEKKDPVKEYIVQTDNQKTYDRIAGEYESKIVSESMDKEILEDKNILLMDLTQA